MMGWLLVLAVPILKNDGLRQWEGLSHIIFMEIKQCLKPPSSGKQRNGQGNT